MTAPRTAVQMFAEKMGVTEAYARQYLSKMEPSEAWDEKDAELRSLAALADLEAVASIDEVDIADAAAEENPKAALKDMIRESSDRHLRAKLAAHTRWANTSERDRREQMEKARDGFEKRFERQVDPDGVLDPSERRRRAEHAKKAHFYKMALKSAQVRRERKGRSSSGE